MDLFGISVKGNFRTDTRNALMRIGYCGILVGSQGRKRVHRALRFLPGGLFLNVFFLFSEFVLSQSEFPEAR